MQILQATICFIILLTIVVFIHEYGHFYVAKKCGVKIEEFAIGMGKKIFGFKDKDGVLWKFCCFPVGGYVKMFSDDNVSSLGGYSDNPSEDELKYALIYKHPLKKVAVAFAGPFMNFVLALVLFFAIFSFHGRPTPEPVIGNVLKGSYADKAGIISGDKILFINGNKILSFNDVRFYISQHHDDSSIKVELLRNNKHLTLDVKYKKGEIFGISGDKIKYEKVSFLDVIKDSFYITFDITKKTTQAIWNMIIYQNGVKSISGPIGIARESMNAVNGGFWTFLFFIATISISLGVINLFPIPLLDGGHIFVNLIEFITRRRFSNFCYIVFVISGGICITLLMSIGIVNDIFFKRNIDSFWYVFSVILCSVLIALLMSIGFIKDFFNKKKVCLHC